MSSDFDFKWLAEKIKFSGNVVTIAGAGMSTSAGIPDFRGPSGLYAILNSGTFEGIPVQSLLPPGVPVEAVFSIDLFRMQPSIFYRIASAIRASLSNAKPTPAHHLVRILADESKLKCHFTQNVDGLERLTGLDPSLLVEAHGTFQTASCLECKASYDFAWLNAKVHGDSPAEVTVPKCDSCSGVVKPDVVLFGEALPETFFQRLQTDARDAEVLIIFGASLVVYPFASLPSIVPPKCHRVFVSLDSPSLGDWGNRSSPDAGKDMAFRGTCDDFAIALVDALGKNIDLSSL